MSSEVEALVAAYLELWNQPDQTRRQTLLEQVWSETGQYADPTVQASGREALNQVIAGFHERFPGSSFSLNGKVDHHHQFVRFSWTLKFANGSTLAGMDFGEIAEDGRLSKITGFF